MILKHLNLSLSLEEYSRSDVSKFGFRSRYIMNYLERGIRQIRWSSEGFDSICIVGRSSGAPSCSIVPDRALLVTVHFDRPRYESLQRGEEHEFLLDMLTAGVEACSTFRSVPSEHIRDAVAAFRRGGYRNEWTHQRRVFRQVGLEASLRCALDPESFLLSLVVKRLGDAGGNVFVKELLRAEPDELIFHHQFKDLHLDGAFLLVTNRFGEQAWRVRIDDLLPRSGPV